MSDIITDKKGEKKTFKSKLITFIKHTKIKVKELLISIKMCFKKEVLN